MKKEPSYKKSKTTLCQGIRCRLFLMYSIPIIVALVSISLFAGYYHYRIARDEAMEYIQTVTRVIAGVVGDHLAVKDTKAIRSHLNSINFKGLEEILILDKEGRVLFAKNDKSLVGKYFGMFCLIRHNHILTKDHTVYVVEPVYERQKLLGYVVVIENLSLLKTIFGYHMHLMCFRIAVLVVIILLVSYVISHRLQSILKRAIFYLRKIAEGEFELPYDYAEGDDIAQLFNEIKRTADHLKQTVILKEYYRGLLNALPHATIIVNEEGKIKEVNNCIAEFMGCSLEDFVDKPLSFICSDLQHIFFEEIKDKPTPLEVRAKVNCKGQDFWVDITVNRVKDLYILLIDDITQEVLEEQRLKELAAKDALTGLLNKTSFWLNLEKELQRAKRKNGVFSLLVIDMDNFKEVNDRYGHDFGDEVLKIIGEILRRSFRAQDIIARYGGDEFCVILTDVDKEMAFTLANRFLKNLKSAKIIAPDGKEITLSASFGIATYPFEAQDSRELFRMADREMYKRKSLNK